MTSPTPTQPASKPPKLPFPLQEGETIIEVCRRHWIYLWPRLSGMALFALAPVVVFAVALAKAGWLDGTVAKVFWIATAVYLVYWGVRLLFAWYRYHNDIWVISNQRIIDSTKTNPLNLKISTTDLVNVQDMSIERNGVLRTVFDYGDILCQTAAEIQEFRLTGIPHPRETQALIDKERDRERLRTRSSTFT